MAFFTLILPYSRHMQRHCRINIVLQHIQRTFYSLVHIRRLVDMSLQLRTDGSSANQCSGTAQYITRPRTFYVNNLHHGSVPN